jgi:hypothetical protein
MPLNKEDLSFKTLINKEFTTPSRAFFQENTVSTLDINDTEVYSNTIPSTTASAISTGVGRVLTDFVLTPDPSFPTSVWYVISGSGFTPGSSTLPSFATSASYYQRNFISDKYGSAYTVILKDNTNTQIFPTDAIGWIFEYKTGILAIADPGSGSYATPYKVTVVQYTGKTLADNRTLGYTGSFSGSLQGTSSYSTQALSSSYALTASFALNGGGGGSTNTGSLLTTASVNLNTITFTKGDGSTFPITINTGSGESSFPYTGSAIITGSLIVTGSIISTLGFTGSLFGTSSFAITASTSITESKTITFNLGSIPTPITTGSKNNSIFYSSYSGSIKGFILTSNTGSTTTLNIWKRNNILPTSSDTIITTNKPQLINNQFTSSYDVSGWITSFSPNDIFLINVESNNSSSYLSLQLITEIYK